MKGLEWEATEEDIRKFLVDVDIEEVILTKNKQGTSNGQAYLKLKSVACAGIAKRYDENGSVLGRRFVVVEAIPEESFIMAVLSNEQ